jgi:hypothetical protein
MDPIRVNQNALYENLCMELRNPAQIRMTQDEARNYAVSSGARFIRLRYNGNAPVCVKGFQTGVLVVANGRNGVQLQWGGKVEQDGTVCKTGRVAFQKDKLGVLWAEVPAFPHNMKLLAACHINDSAEWVITNESDKSEIAELAEKYATELGWSREKIERKTSSAFRKLAPVQKPVEKPKVEEVKAPVVTTVIDEPVFNRNRPGRPRLRPNLEAGVNADHNAVGNVH